MKSWTLELACLFSRDSLHPRPVFPHGFVAKSSFTRAASPRRNKAAEDRGKSSRMMCVGAHLSPFGVSGG